MRIVIALLILIPVLSACVPVGSFCDIAEDLRTTNEVSAFAFDNDEAFARKLAVHNSDYANCP